MILISTTTSIKIMSKSKPSKKNGTVNNSTKHSIKRVVSSYNLFYTLEHELVLKVNGIPAGAINVLEDNEKKLLRRFSCIPYPLIKV